MRVNNNKDIPIYLVSLRSDTQRRANLEERFPEQYRNFIHLEAVNGRELSAQTYYEKNSRFFTTTRPMTPSELGCTLSHIQVLQAFVNSGHDRALIIEDDVLGTDRDIERIIEVSGKLAEDSLLLCGGQDASRLRKYLYGKETAVDGVYEVCRFSYRYIFGTCCYLVTKSSARAILEYQNTTLTVADKWAEFFKGTGIEIYYAPILAHPSDFGNSHIEKDRAVFYRAGLRKHIFTWNVFANAFWSLKRNYEIFACKARGCKNIHE